MQYWHVISRLAPAVSVGSVQDMGEVQTELGKVGGCLSFIHTVASSPDAN